MPSVGVLASGLSSSLSSSTRMGSAVLPEPRSGRSIHQSRRLIDSVGELIRQYSMVIDTISLTIASKLVVMPRHEGDAKHGEINRETRRC